MRRSAGLVMVLAVAVCFALVADLDGSTAAGPAITPPPTPEPERQLADCTTSLQSLIDRAPAGARLTVPECTYRESVIVTKPLLIDGGGAIIDGRDEPGGPVVRSMWMTIDASDVVIDNFTMRRANNRPQTGALRISDGVANVTIRDCDLSWADGAAVAYGGANDSTVTGCAIHDNGQLGVHIGRDIPGTDHGWRNTLAGNRIYRNRRPAVEIGENGGLKATLQHALVIRDNDVYDNDGPGIWLDVSNIGSVISGNRVHGNRGPGIMFETSDGAAITGNVVWDNGWAAAVWGWGAGILVSSSRAAEVADNIVAWNYAGISVISQDRPDSPGNTGNHVHDNVIVQRRPGDRGDNYGLFWGDDGAGTLYADGAGNGGSANRYYYPANENKAWRFIWNGGRSRLDDFNATPGEEGGRYLTSEEKDALLAAANVPTNP